MYLAYFQTRFSRKPSVVWKSSILYLRLVSSFGTPKFGNILHNKTYFTLLRDILRWTKRIVKLLVPVSKQKSSRHRERVREKEIIELKRLLHRVDRLQAYHFDLSGFFAVTPRPWRTALAILILWLDSGCTIKRAEHLNQITRASTG